MNAVAEVWHRLIAPKGEFGPGAVLTCMIVTLVCYRIMWVHPGDLSIFLYLLVPVSLATLILTLRTATIASILIIGGAAVIVFARSPDDVSLTEWAYLVALVAVTGVLLVTAQQRDRIERNRRARLSEQADLLAEAQRVAHVGSWEWDIVNNKLTWSNEIYRIFGLQPHEFGATYDAFLNSVHPDDRDRVQGAVDDALHQNKPYALDHRIVLPAGGQRIVHEQAEVTFDKSGRALRMLGTVQDITARKQLELALTEAKATLEARVAERTDELKTREQWYRTLVETIPYGVSETDLSGTVVYCNPVRCEMLGYTADELIGKKSWDLDADPRNNRRSYTRRVHALAKEQPPPRPEITKARKNDGSTIDVQVDWNYKRDSDGAVIGFVSVFSDLTEQKRLMAALHESEATLRDLAEHIEQVFYVRDVHQRQMLYVSSAYERIWGRPLSAIYDDPTDFLKVVHPADFQRVYDAMRNQAEGEYFNDEYRIVRDDGDTRWIQASTFPIRGDDGDVHRIAGLAQDVTDRKRVEERIRESEERFRQLAENINAVFWMITPDHNDVLYISPAFEEVWGRPRDLKNTSEWFATIHTKDKARIRRLFRETADTEPFDCEYRITRPDGTVRWIRDRGFPVRNDSGEVYRMAGIAEDVTERKRAQQALEESREQLRRLALHQESDREALRTRIAREVHDELGQTLTAFDMDLHWLTRHRHDPDEIEAKAREMQRSVSQLIQAVQKIASELRPFILDDLGLEAAIGWYIEQFERKSGLQCKSSVSLHPVQIPEDYAITLYRILQETLTNILRHAGATKVVVEVRHGDDCLIMSVSDDGTGIAPASVQRNDAFGIIGIRERVHALQGQLDIGPTPRGGTRVHVTLPIPPISQAQSSLSA